MRKSVEVGTPGWCWEARLLAGLRRPLFGDSGLSRGLQARVCS